MNTKGGAVCFLAHYISNGEKSHISPADPDQSITLSCFFIYSCVYVRLSELLEMEICQHIHSDLGVVVPVKQAAVCQARCSLHYDLVDPKRRNRLRSKID